MKGNVQLMIDALSRGQFLFPTTDYRLPYEVPMRPAFLLLALLALQGCATTDLERAKNAYFVSARAYQDCVPEYADRLWRCEDYRRTMIADARRLHAMTGGRY